MAMPTIAPVDKPGKEGDEVAVADTVAIVVVGAEVEVEVRADVLVMRVSGGIGSPGLSSIFAAAAYCFWIVRFWVEF